VALMAVAFPILPGQTDAWKAFIAEINGARHADFAASRQRVGAHELTFLQSTPMGDLVLVTLEADDPAKAFGQIVSAKDPFTLWFLERVKAIHGVDLAVPMHDAPSHMVVDSKRAAVAAR
jgi:hypothetical protein